MKRAMAATITTDLMRRLAEFRAQKGPALSLYLNLDPAVAPTQPEVATRINSVLSEAARQADELRDELSHDERETLKGDLERVERWFDDEFDRDGAYGVAVFVAGADGFWSAQPLAAPVPDEVRIGRELHLGPLATVASGGGDALVAYVGRERADIYRLRDATLEPVVDETEQVPGKHDQGGWSQARYERHIENIVGQHLRRVADSLEHCVRESRNACVVLVGSEEIRSEFEALLANDVKQRLAGWAAAERHASPADLQAAAEPVLAAWRAGRETELIERWREGAATHGRASSGWVETLAAASDGRVEVLLVHEGASRPAYRCPECGRAESEAGSCPLDGATLEERHDGLDLAVQQTLAHGGHVEAIRTRRDLEPVEGIGALLRF